MLRQRVQKVIQAETEVSAGRLSWDDIRLFLAVARSGSFRTAANSTKLSSNTLRKRISMLETNLGQILLARQASGVSVTAEGLEVMKIAERIRDEAGALERM